MKHLKIEYTTESGSTITLFDEEVIEVNWSDTSSGVRVEGKTQAAASNGMGGLLDLLTGASKARTEAMVEEKKAELAEEAAAETPAPQVVDADPIEVIQAAQA